MIPGITLIQDTERDIPGWLKARQGMITATKIADIAGCGFRSPLERWAIETGKVADDTNQDDPILEAGRHNESLIVKLAGRKLGRPVRPLKMFVRHADLEWAATSLDGLVEGPDELLEAKMVRGEVAHQWSELGGPPKYEIQLCWEMGVVGIPSGYLAAMIAGDARNIVTPRYVYSQEFFDDLCELAERFRECIRRDVPPDPGPGDSRTIEAIVRREQGRSRPLSPVEVEDFDDRLFRIAQLKAQKKKADADAAAFGDEIKTLENGIKLALGDCSRGEFPDGRRIEISRVDVSQSVTPAYSYTKLYLKNPAAKSSRKRGRATA